MKVKNLFIYGLMKDSLRFVKDYSHLKNIDKSHNQHHSLEVLFWSSDIIQHSGKTLSASDCIIISESCILHDMIDKKYNGQKQEVEHYLLKKYGQEKEVEITMKMMDTISYSKTFVNNTVHFPEWLQESTEYNDAYHIVRESDLLQHCEDD
jgi:HD superfamily phosphodiesterase